MRRLRDRIRDEGFAHCGFDVDARETPQQIRAFADELELDFDVLHDRSDYTATQYRVYGLPQSFVIDRNGMLVRLEFGAMVWDDSPFVSRIRHPLEAIGTR